VTDADAVAEFVKRHNPSMQRRLQSLYLEIEAGDIEGAKFAFDQVSRCWEKILRESGRGW
jgi:hypothetical protein